MENNSKNSNRGFAGMDEDKQREIASKGGRSSSGSHSGSSSHGEDKNRRDHEGNKENYNFNSDSHKGKQGFASMDEDKQREIASKGGRASHGGRGSHDDSDSSHR